MDQTIIITGGAGFIGSNLVRFLLHETEARLLILDKLTYAGHLANLEAPLKDPRCRFEKADIADREAMERVFKEHRPSAVINLAAESHVDRSIDGPRAFVQTNVVGTFELLEATRAYLTTRSNDERAIFRYLQVSTDEVFGSLGSSGAFTEDTPYAPRSPYSATKASADHLVGAYVETFNIPALITNCSNNFGPYQFPEKLVPLMILNALAGEPLPIYGDGGNIRDWLYVDDHCRGILAVLKSGRVGQKYNIGTTNELSNIQMVDSICAQLETVAPAGDNAALRAKGVRAYAELKKFVADRPGHDRRYAIDATKIREELGWHPQSSFEAALRETVEWYVHNRAWCTGVQADRVAKERLGIGNSASTARAATQ